jgi:hypothetical protein
MSVLERIDFYQEVREFAANQIELVIEIKKNNPKVSDWKLLINLPKQGKILANGKVWGYKKHGAGIEFNDADGLVIDAHDHLDKQINIVDAHRISEYLRSKYDYINNESNIYHLCKVGLLELESSGRLRRASVIALAWELS